MEKKFPARPEHHKGVGPKSEDCATLLSNLLSGHLSDVETTWRVSPIFSRSTREYESIQRRASFKDFQQWIVGSLQPDNPLADLPPHSASQVSIYADYKHTNMLFGKQIASGLIQIQNGNISINSADKMQEILSWKTILNTLGLLQVVSSDSIPTIWVGSRGCHSPLHYDTYGKNIVVQLHGRKRWLLWPPSEAALSRQRVPYEESSIYSDFDPMPYLGTGGEISEVIRSKFPDMLDIVLEEGDVLLVPAHWWHFVLTVRLI